jgi:tetratricopeptide (TPR) repeat protein
MKAQAGGAVPAVIPNGALWEVVRFGFRTRRGYFDIQPTEVGELEAEWLDGRIGLLRSPEQQNLIRHEMIPASKARFAWSAVVDQWEREFAESTAGPDNHIAACTVGVRSQDPQTYANDRDSLPAEGERNPEDARSVFDLAQSYFDRGDFVKAREGYARRVEMGGWDEEVYYAKYRIAESMEHLGEPWPDIQNAYLKAWEFRPTRAEPLYAIARRYRVDQHYRLGYLFAERAAQIPFPEGDQLFVRSEIHAWCASDEQAGAHPGSAGTPRRLRSTGACLPYPTYPTETGKGSRPIATYLHRR